MTNLNTAASRTAPKETVHLRSEFALAKIGTSWKGNGITAAAAAALEIGMLNAGGMLAYDKARTAVSRGFNVRRVDEKYWSTVSEAFNAGRHVTIKIPDLAELLGKIGFSPNERGKMSLPTNIA